MPKIPLLTIPKGYRSQSRDTSVEMDYLQCSLWRKMSLIKKAELTIGITQGCRELTLQGIKNKYPQFTSQKHKVLYAKHILCQNKININFPSNFQHDIMIGNPIELALLISEIFESLDIIYFVGGSIASSLWGESRATLDLNLVADLNIEKVNDFITKIEPFFYFSETAIQEAIINKSCFNLIHFQTSEKIDIFIPSQKPLIQAEIQRRILQKVTENDDYLYLATAEDIILQKLIWYRDGNQISKRQWRDILGVLKVQSRDLDFDYLKSWAEVENLLTLLNKALLESGL